MLSSVCPAAQCLVGSCMRVSGSSLGWNEVFVFLIAIKISVYLVEHTQPGISPPVLKTSPVHGAQHI